MVHNIKRTRQHKSVELTKATSNIKATRAKAHSDNTRLAYNQDFTSFQNWCIDNSFDFLPTSPRTVELYLESNSHLKLSTLMRRVSGINLAHRKAGFEKPTDQGLGEYMKGLKNSRKASPVKKAKPIRKADILEVCKALYNTSKPKDLRDRTILLCGWFGAFRRSELARMTWTDEGGETLTKSEKGYTYNMRYSKTDQTGKGKVKVLPYQSEISICPVRALDELRKISSGNCVFMAMSKSGKILHDCMSSKAVERVVKKYFGKEAAAHGLRSGFITEAAVKGNSMASIANQTGSKDMQTLKGYIQEVDAWENNAALNI